MFVNQVGPAFLQIRHGQNDLSITNRFCVHHDEILGQETRTDTSVPADKTVNN